MWYKASVRFVASLLFTSLFFVFAKALADTVVPLEFSSGVACSFDAAGQGALIDESATVLDFRRERKRLAVKRGRLAKRVDRIALRPESDEQNATRLERLTQRLTKLDLALEELDACRVGVKPTPTPGITGAGECDEGSECAEVANPLAIECSGTRFSADPIYGDASNYTFKSPNRWSVASDENDCRLFLNTSAYSSTKGGRLGETALVTSGSYTDFTLSIRSKSAENLVQNKAADYALVFGYRDSANYCYMLFDERADQTALYAVQNGRRSKLQSSARAGIVDNAYHKLLLIRSKAAISVFFDDAELLAVKDSRCSADGAVGFGSLNDSAYFDDVVVSAGGPTPSPTPTATPLPTASPTPQPTATPTAPPTPKATPTPVPTATPPLLQQPFLGSPISLPGVIEAEYFDKGGQDVAYHDNVPSNRWGLFRTTEDVDIIASQDPAGGQYVVNNFETGEWLEYTVRVAQAGSYQISLRATSAFSTSSFSLELDGQELVTAAQVPNTGSWWNFQDVGKTIVQLPAGDHVLRVVAVQQYFDLNSIKVAAAVGPTPTPTATPSPTPSPTATPAPLPTATPTPTPTPTATPVPTATPKPTPIPTPRAGDPELPRAYVGTTYDPAYLRAADIVVRAGGDLQAALNAAQPGDLIEMEAGATFIGNFTLPKKSGNEWIYVVSSARNQLPANGRVGPEHAAYMPKIVPKNTLRPALIALHGAHHYRLAGIEVKTAEAMIVLVMTGYGLPAGSTSLWDLQPASSLDELPHHITLDRMLIHSTSDVNKLRVGLSLNGRHMAVINSYIANVKDGPDSQAIFSFNGDGPYKIVNNFLEAGGENIMFGGTDPKVVNLVPSDIEIRGNHFYKRLDWYIQQTTGNERWNEKNLFELKNAQRVLLNGNVFENSWSDAQRGYAIVLTPRNQSGTCPWCVVQDVTIESNLIRNVGWGFHMLGVDYNRPSQQTKRIRISNNLLENVSSTFGSNTHLLQVSGALPVLDLTVTHNTFLYAIDDTLPGKQWLFLESNGGKVVKNLVLKDNITAHGNYGPNLNYADNAELANNAIVFDPRERSYSTYITKFNSTYPGNFKADTLAAVGFANAQSGDYRLTSTSPFKNKATDGTDLGVDMNVLSPTAACAKSGACGS